MKKQLMRLAASVGLVGVLAIGAIVMIPSEASAAPPCGLRYHEEKTPGGTWKVVYFTVRNCHSYTVRRKLDIAGGNDSDCWTIRPGWYFQGWKWMNWWQYIRDIKPC